MLSVLFLLLTCYFAGMVWGAATNRRPLNLITDLGTATGTTSLYSTVSSLALVSQAPQKAERISPQDTFGNRIPALRARGLVERTQITVTTLDMNSVKPAKSGPWFSTSTKLKKDANYDWRPSKLQKKWLTILLVILVIVATLLVLRELAFEHKLYRTAFVYQVDLDIFNAKFSPYPVIATLFALNIGLCWGGIDIPMRTLQPYLSNSRKPATVSREARLSYHSSNLIWVTIKAASRRNWILCLVAIGTTLSQVHKCTHVQSSSYQLIGQLSYQLLRCSNEKLFLYARNHLCAFTATRKAISVGVGAAINKLLSRNWNVQTPVF
jgi:hypothetical protein